MDNFDIGSLLTLEFSDVKPCTKKVSAKLSMKDLSKGFENEALELTKFADIPGFRHGKAPLFLVKNRFSSVILDQLKHSIMNSIFDRISNTKDEHEDKKFDMLGYSNLPALEEIPFKEGEDFSLSFEFEVAPEFKLPNYADIKVEVEKEKVLEEEINEQIDKLKHMYGKYEDSDGTVSENDMLEVSLKSDITLPNNASEETKRLTNCELMWVWVRKPEMIPGINKAVIGAKIGDSLEFVSEYPSDFRDSFLAGKKVSYHTTICKIQHHVPLSDMDELCKRIKAKDMNEIKENIIKDLEDMKQRKHEMAIQNKCVEELYAKTQEFPFPEIMLNQFISDEAKLYIQQNVINEEQAKDFQEKKDEHMNKIKDVAKEHLRRFLIMRKIASSENIRVEEEDMNRELSMLSRHYGINEKNLRKNISNPLAERLHMSIIENKVSEFLAKTCAKQTNEKQ
jgi:trigger factor